MSCQCNVHNRNSDRKVNSYHFIPIHTNSVTLWFRLWCEPGLMKKYENKCSMNSKYEMYKINIIDMQYEITIKWLRKSVWSTIWASTLNNYEMDVCMKYESTMSCIHLLHTTMNWLWISFTSERKSMIKNKFMLWKYGFVLLKNKSILINWCKSIRIF